MERTTTWRKNTRIPHLVKKVGCPGPLSKERPILLNSAGRPVNKPTYKGQTSSGDCGYNIEVSKPLFVSQSRPFQSVLRQHTYHNKNCEKNRNPDSNFNAG